ncbi:MAG: hypothetical protein M3417_10910 [Actinomycetota bacterium]|nr:hypothetical protein [Actinomycetota bacterium]
MRWLIAAGGVAAVYAFALAGAAVLAAGFPGCGRGEASPSAEALAGIPGKYLARDSCGPSRVETGTSRNFGTYEAAA